MKICKTYLFCALFSVLAPLQAFAQSIVGAWSFGDTTKEDSGVSIMFANGCFIQIQNAKAGDAPHGVDGFERGTYTWNPATGAFTFTLLQDLNGDYGFSGAASISGITMSISGDTATLNIPGVGAFPSTRVTGASPIVGAWGGCSTTADNSFVVVFLPNNTYFMATDDVITTGGHDGIEIGTYAWNATTGVLTTSRTPSPPFANTDGDYGFSDTPPPTIHISADGLTLNGAGATPADAFVLPRVGAAASATVANYQGMWAVPNLAEAGWGINFTHQGDVLFASWFTYDANGKPFWVSMTATQQPDGSFTGAIDQTSGSPFSAVPYDPTHVTHNTVGTGRVTFSDANNGTFSYTLNGIAQVKSLSRFLFAAPVPVCTFNSALAAAQALNYTDMWAVPNLAEPGWGINFTHQGDVLFVSWFIYDANGAPFWVSATLTKTVAGTYAGALDVTTGPPFSSVPFDSSHLTHSNVGTATVTFTDGNNGTFTYTLNGVSRTKALTRFVFHAPGTVCQ